MRGARALAVRHGRALVAGAPDHVDGWNLLGEALKADDPAGAEDAWRAAVAARPGAPEAHFHLGNLARERGALAVAVAEYEAALAADPDNPAVINNLGLAHEALGDKDAAEACYRRVLARDAFNTDALANLANVLFARGEYVATEDVYERLFALRARLPAYVWLQRGHALRNANRFIDAETCFRAALEEEPGKLPILANLAQALDEQGRYTEAVPILVEIIARQPDNGLALTVLCAVKQKTCDWSGLETQFATLRGLLDEHPDGGASPPNPFPVLSMPLAAKYQRSAARGWSTQFGAPGAMPPALSEMPAGKLRIGFVSSDLRGHAMTFLALEHWEKLRGGRLETFAYSLHPDEPGERGERIRNAFDHYSNVDDDSAPTIAARIRADGIGVLFDCNGHTRLARPAIFALRPAPVQVNYIGFPGTMGAPWYDYIFADPFGLPPEAEQWFDEKPLRMPHASFPSDTRRAPTGPAPARSAHGLPDDAFVFICFNNNNKILRDVFAIWMRLLAAVEGSVLWLVAANDDVERNLKQEAAARGIAPARLIFAQPVSMQGNMARLPLADLFLDTLPYGAHTTANDALLMGLPVLTCTGECLVSRIAGSQLLALGVPELVTGSLAEYEAMALKLARDRPLLRSLRARVAANRATHPLFDMDRYSADFEEIVLRAWADYVATAR
jgi:predicted O-linked N-acetylglucosamine transferase (SPINDLY family)